MRVLITGMGGFVAPHLAEYCRSKGAEVHGLKRSQADLLDAKAIERIIHKIKPERIFHLAALTSVPSSWAHPKEAFFTNVLGTYHVLEAARTLKKKPRVHIACSSEEYGRVRPKDAPLREDRPLRPVSPYGLTKVGQDVLGRFYYEAFGLPVIVTRSFNHTGPGQDDRFVAGSFAKQVAQTEPKVGKHVIYTGNLDNIRDFSDVRDVARAYWMVLEKGRPGQAYNVASGRGIRVRYIAETLVGMSSQPIRLEKEKARVRKHDVPLVVGDASKLRRDTGWKPGIPFEKTLLDLLNDWRGKVALKSISEKSKR